MRRAIKMWLPFGLVLTVAVAVAYGIGQQVLRQSANDPQIQLAQDWAAQVETGTAVTSLNLGPFIDPAKSLAPFGIVYNKDGTIANSSVAAPTSMAQPAGVFTTVDSSPNKEVRFTWQPSSGERYAVVIKRTSFADKTYYVLAGRNLYEIESRIGKVGLLALGAWLAGQIALIATLNAHVARRAIRHVAARRKK